MRKQKHEDDKIVITEAMLPFTDQAGYFQYMLKGLAKDGMAFSDCVKFFHSLQTPAQNALAAKAAEEYEDEGTLEIDDNAIVSDSTESNEDGAYVMAWVWVSK